MPPVPSPAATRPKRRSFAMLACPRPRRGRAGRRRPRRQRRGSRAEQGHHAAGGRPARPGDRRRRLGPARIGAVEPDPPGSTAGLRVGADQVPCRRRWPGRPDPGHHERRLVDRDLAPAGMGRPERHREPRRQRLRDLPHRCRLLPQANPGSRRGDRTGASDLVADDHAESHRAPQRPWPGTLPSRRSLPSATTSSPGTGRRRWPSVAMRVLTTRIWTRPAIGGVRFGWRRSSPAIWRVRRVWEATRNFQRRRHRRARTWRSRQLVWSTRVTIPSADAPQGASSWSTSPIDFRSERRRSRSA